MKPNHGRKLQSWQDIKSSSVDRLPVGVLEPDHMEFSSSQDDVSLSRPLSSNKECDGVDASGQDNVSNPLSSKEHDGINASDHDDMSSPLLSNTVYVEIFEGRKFCCFRG